MCEDSEGEMIRVGLTDKISVGVILHQRSGMNPDLFSIIMDGSPWCMLFADDIVLCSTTREDVEKNDEGMGRRGLKISRKTTVYMRFNRDGGTWIGTQITVYRGENLERVTTVKYLEATLAENGDLDAEMTHRIQSGQKKRKTISGILCDRWISLRVMGKYTRRL